MEVQCRHGVNAQAFEQAVSQEACRLVQRCFTLGRITHQHREVNLRMRVVGRNIDGVNGHHANARVFKLADQLGQITLDLVGDSKAAVGDGFLVT